MNINQKPDYGPAGCCGPAAFAMLTVLVGLGVLVAGWIA
jgi:hypothetical protein